LTLIRRPHADPDSFTYPDHELAVGKIAEQIGFKHISLSSQLLPMIRMVPRGVSTTADAYLTPVLGDYLDGFYAGFAGGRKGGLKVEFMGSDGGLVNLDVSAVRSSCESGLTNRTSLA
jgi:5-oxoprolinase (ATP-hydrolysing)